MLVLVRHGRTPYNAARRLLGRIDVPLDELGVRQAAALTDAAALAGVERVISSPLVRARATALAIGRPIEIDQRWTEIDYGIYDGLPLTDVPESVWDKWRIDQEWAPEGGESMADMARRVRSALDELWDEASEHDVAVVSHVSPIKAAIDWALGVSLGTPTRMFVATASISRIGVGRGGPLLHSFNETHHRPSE